MSDLGTLPGDVDSFAGGINHEGRVVGESCNASGICRGYLWQDGSIYDLNALVPASDSLDLPFGSNINDSGEITAATVNASGVESAVVLIPRGSAGVSRNGASVPKFTLREGLRMRLLNQRARYWDLRKRLQAPR
jgi:probable HAF family extracellular repeat protein